MTTRKKYCIEVEDCMSENGRVVDVYAFSKEQASFKALAKWVNQAIQEDFAFDTIEFDFNLEKDANEEGFFVEANYVDYEGNEGSIQACVDLADIGDSR
jgi:GTPase SAR1 family protein